MKEDDLNRAVEEYEKNWKLYESFSIKLRQLLRELLGEKDLDVENVEFRTKSVESFSEKIRREDKSYDEPLSQVTDLCGLRIVTYYLEDVERAGDIIRGEFLVDEENSLDKSEAMDPDRFGYLSVHYVVSLSEDRGRLTEWKLYSGLKAEIQVRTVLQHAWAAINHKLRYKSAREVPTNLQRQLSRLSALLELADTEFASLRNGVAATIEEYTTSLEQGRLELEVNLDSLDTYLVSSEVFDKWVQHATAAGFREVPGALNIDDLLRSRSRLLNLIQCVEIATIAELDALLGDADKWGPEFLRRLSEESERAGYVPVAWPDDVIAFLVLRGRKDAFSENVVDLLDALRPELRDSILTLCEYEQ